MARSFTQKRGFDIRLAAPPEDRIHDGPVLSGAALLGTDYPGLRARFEVATGDRVAAGQVLFRDRARPAIAFVAPVSGTVAGIDLGPRRTLSALRIACDTPDTATPAPRTPPADTRAHLLDSGLWPAFQARPFGRIPDPGAVPAAIFVRAMDTHPLAANPVTVLADAKPFFASGLAALSELTEGPVYLCQAPGPDLVSPPERVEILRFGGPHPAGLSGTHIHRAHAGPVGDPVWTIGYQDVLDIGRLRETGVFSAARVISLAGPRVRQPRLLRTAQGAALRDLTEGEIESGPVRLLAGSVLSGHEAAYLGRRATQVTVIDAREPVPRGRLAGWLAAHRAPRGPSPIVPTEALERAAPPGVSAPVPLLRALATGDVEAAERFGALGLIEEDMALLSSVCTSRADYGALLRRVLDELEDAV